MLKSEGMFLDVRQRGFNPAGQLIENLELVEEADSGRFMGIKRQFLESEFGQAFSAANGTNIVQQTIFRTATAKIIVPPLIFAATKTISIAIKMTSLAASSRNAVLTSKFVLMKTIGGRTEATFITMPFEGGPAKAKIIHAFYNGICMISASPAVIPA